MYVCSNLVRIVAVSVPASLRELLVGLRIRKGVPCRGLASTALALIIATTKVDSPSSFPVSLKFCLRDSQAHVASFTRLA